MKTLPARAASFAILSWCLGLLVLDAQPFYPAPGSPFSVGSLPGYFGVGDFNGDGNRDVLIGTGTVMLSDGHGKFIRHPGPPFAPDIRLTEGAVIIADFNGDGRSDIAIASIHIGSPYTLTV